MSFKASMIVNKSFPMTVLSASYEFTQDIDSWNRPNGSVCGGMIEVTLSADYNIDLLARWMLEDSSKMSGSIIFTRRDGMSTLRTITFLDAFCVGFKEEYATDGGDSSMLLTLTISANEININTPLLAYENNWFESSAAAKAMKVGGAASGGAGMVGSGANEIVRAANDTRTMVDDMKDKDTIDRITSFSPVDDGMVMNAFTPDDIRIKYDEERKIEEERRSKEKEDREEAIRQEAKDNNEGITGSEEERETKRIEADERKTIENEEKEQKEQKIRDDERKKHEDNKSD